MMPIARPSFKTIINIPIEPLEERYSIQWRDWFAEGFNETFKVIDVDGKLLTKIIERGNFLDICGTNYFKAHQLGILCTLLHNDYVRGGDVLFFHDIWFPGLEMLAYIRDGLGVDIKICGCLHAGTYDPFDFLHQKGMDSWGKDIENGWFQIIDKIFVATNFHKELIFTQRNVDPNKIVVTGFPIKPQEREFPPKKDMIVFPHRLDPEKNPIHFDMLKEQDDSEWEYVKTKEECESKEEYYYLLELASIAISYASQETWGIAMQEAVFAGCIPIVPDCLSYQEMYPRMFRYHDIKEVPLILKDIRNNRDIYLEAVSKLQLQFKADGIKAIDNIKKEIINL